MRRWGAVGLVGPCLLLFPETKAVDIGLGLRAGTQGLGVEYGIGVSEWLGVRGAGYRGDLSTEYDDSGIEYDSTLMPGGYGAFADFYPAKNGFRISVGLLSNRNEVGSRRPQRKPRADKGYVQCDQPCLVAQEVQVASSPTPGPVRANLSTPAGGPVVPGPEAWPNWTWWRRRESNPRPEELHGRHLTPGRSSQGTSSIFDADAIATLIPFAARFSPSDQRIQGYLVISAAVGGPSTQFTSQAASTVMNVRAPAGSQASWTIFAGM